MKTIHLHTHLFKAAIPSALALAAWMANQAHADLIYGVSDQLGQLVSFNSATPGTLLSAVALTGTVNGEQIRGVDYVNGVLYGLGDASHLYTINVNNGVCTQVGSGTFSTSLSGIEFGFTAGSSAFYVSSDLGQNLSLTASGAATAGTSYASGLGLDTLAYNPLSSTFYGISASSHDIYTVNPLTGGATLAGSTGVSFLDTMGLSISTAGAGYFAGTIGGQTEFFGFNPSTLALTLLGDVGPAGDLPELNSITVAPTTVPEPGAISLSAIGGALTLILLRNRGKNASKV